MKEAPGCRRVTQDVVRTDGVAVNNNGAIVSYIAFIWSPSWRRMRQLNQKRPQER